MADRIVLCGLNGCGKSTLGALLARRLGYVHMDIEDYFFPSSDPVFRYAAQRPLEQVCALLLEDLCRWDRVVFSAVDGSYGKEVEALFDRAIYLHAPREIRMERIRDRSRKQFGPLAEPGGELYRQEADFLAMAQGRKEERVLQWLEKLSIPVLSVDASAPIPDLLENVLQQI